MSWIASSLGTIGGLLSGEEGNGDSEKPTNSSAEVENKEDSTTQETDNSKWELTDEEEYRLVIERLKGWYDTPTDDEGKLNKELFLARLDVAFDKSFVRHSEGNVDADYETFVKEATALCKGYNFEFKLFRYKRIEPGIFNSYVRYSSGQDDMVITGKLYYKKGKIYKAEVLEVIKPRVAGQTTATTELLTSSFTAQQLAARVVELPSLSKSMLLAPELGMLPADERYEMLKLKMRYRMTNLFKARFRRHDEILIFQDEKGEEPYVGGAQFKYTKKRLGRYESLLLTCSKGIGRAFCEKNADHGFTIFGTHPVVSGDHAHAEPQMKECGEEGQSHVVAFYPWFRVQLLGNRRDKDNFAFVLISVDVTQDGERPKDGGVAGAKKVTDFEPLFKIVPKDQKSGAKKTYTVSDYYHDADKIFVIRADKKTPQDGKEVEVDVAPGVDPAMALCVAACMEELAG